MVSDVGRHGDVSLAIVAVAYFCAYEDAVLCYVKRFGLRQPYVSVYAAAFIKPSLFERCIGSDAHDILASEVDIVGDIVVLG